MHGRPYMYTHTHEPCTHTHTCTLVGGRVWKSTLTCHDGWHVMQLYEYGSFDWSLMPTHQSTQVRFLASSHCCLCSPLFCSPLFFHLLSPSLQSTQVHFSFGNHDGFRLKTRMGVEQDDFGVLGCVWCAASPVHARVTPRLAMQGFAFTVVPTRAHTHTHIHTTKRQTKSLTRGEAERTRRMKMGQRQTQT